MADKPTYEELEKRIQKLEQEVTDHKKTGCAVRESEEKYRSMMEAMKDPVYICSQDYRVEYMNPAMVERTGYDAIGENCFNVLHRLEKKCPWCLHHRVQQGECCDQEIISPKDLRSYHVSQSPIVHDDGSISKMTIYKDITDFKKIESQLRQAQKIEAIGALAGGIAHDFNNILFPIVGFAEMMAEDLPANSDLHKNIDEILAGAKRAKDLIKQILTFCRQSEHDVKALRPHLIIKEVIKLARSTIPASIEIKQFIDPKTRPILADPTQIYQVAMNLITNAYQAITESVGVLTIRLQNSEDIDISGQKKIPPGKGPYVLLSIGDTGGGIDKIALEKIFDPYFTTKSKGKGTGLGLSVVHGIVRKYGGQINVSSSLGRGSTFDVYLPAAKEAMASRLHQEMKPLPTGNERILLVDDEKQVLLVEQMILERLGYKVGVSDNSSDAIKAIKADPDGFDLIISDLTMPTMTGDQFAVEIMKIKSTLPIIICTGFSERISYENLKSIGVKALLMKPIIKSKLAATVRKVLDETKKDIGKVKI
ncbi:MAG: response regulator [Proteobacteria bacterium]|nr:response regulator [Pseudomonadota bacterium]